MDQSILGFKLWQESDQKDNIQPSTRIVPGVSEKLILFRNLSSYRLNYLKL